MVRIGGRSDGVGGPGDLLDDPLISLLMRERVGPGVEIISEPSHAVVTAEEIIFAVGIESDVVKIASLVLQHEDAVIPHIPFDPQIEVSFQGSRPVNGSVEELAGIHIGPDCHELGEPSLRIRILHKFYDIDIESLSRCAFSVHSPSVL